MCIGKRRKFQAVYHFASHRLSSMRSPVSPQSQSRHQMYSLLRDHMAQTARSPCPVGPPFLLHHLAWPVCHPTSKPSAPRIQLNPTIWRSWCHHHLSRVSPLYVLCPSLADIWPIWPKQCIALSVSRLNSLFQLIYVACLYFLAGLCYFLQHTLAVGSISKTSQLVAQTCSGLLADYHYAPSWLIYSYLLLRHLSEATLWIPMAVEISPGTSSE